MLKLIVLYFRLQHCTLCPPSLLFHHRQQETNQQQMMLGCYIQGNTGTSLMKKTVLQLFFTMAVKTCFSHVVGMLCCRVGFVNKKQAT